MRPSNLLVWFALSLAIGSPRSVHADTIFSNLGPGDTYSPFVGAGIGGPFGDEQGLGFTPSADFSLDTLALPLYHDDFLVNPNVVDVFLRSSTNGGPGSILESFHFVDAMKPVTQIDSHTLLVGTSSTHPLLNAHTQYWVTASSTSAATWMHTSALEDHGPIAFRERFSEFGIIPSDFQWAVHDSPGPREALRVTGTPVSPPPPPSFADVLNGAVTASVSEDKSQISGGFTPNFNLTLTDAAALGGYDHFNWLNLVTRDTFLSSPAGFLNTALRTQTGALPTTPYIDPPAGGYQYMIGACSASTGATCSFPVRDSLPGYWDEVFTGDGTTPGPLQGTQLQANLFPFSPRGNVAATTLHFEDTPNTFIGFEVDFSTWLLGVSDTGPARIIDGTRFDWRVLGGFPDGTLERRSNVDPVGGLSTVEFLGFAPAGTFSEEERALFAGNAIGIDATLPEPPTLALIAAGIMCLALCGFIINSRRS